MNTISDIQPTEVSPLIDSSFLFGCQGLDFLFSSWKNLKAKQGGGQLAQNSKIAHHYHLDEQRAWRGRGLVGNLIILDLTMVNASQFPNPLALSECEGEPVQVIPVTRVSNV